MKRTLSLVLMMLLCMGVFAGCSGNNNNSTSSIISSEPSSSSISSEDMSSSDLTKNTTDEAIDVKVGALKGPTAMGMVKLMDEVDSGEVVSNKFDFTIAAAIDEITPKLTQGELDIAAVPANLASVLYNNTEGKVQVMAINTLGVLYIVESGDSIQSVEDLRGKTIYASGKGATPEYALNYILNQNGINPETDVTIEWKSEHSECVAALAADDTAIAMLPQPFVTTAQASNENLRVALDLTEQWDFLQALQSDTEKTSALITGVVVVRTEFAKENPEAVSDFLDRYSESVKFVNENTEEAAKLIGGYDIVTAEVAAKALPYCNITFIEGSEMKEKLSGYLSVLFEQAPESVGGTLPDDAFYYER